MDFIFKKIATVQSARSEAIDDGWASINAQIVLEDDLPVESLAGIEAFSHLEIIYCFHKVAAGDVVLAGHPRGNPSYPLTGIFAQRKKDRPNAIGLCTIELIRKEGRTLTVKYLDAIDGTPVLDIKPVMKEFEPLGDIRQPEWATDLMKNYW